MFPLAELDPTAVGAFITALLGGGVWAGYRVLRTAGPEANAIGNKSLIEVNTELRTEIKRLSGVVDLQRTEIDRQSQQLRDQALELDKAADRIRALNSELNDLESRRDELGN
jgi:uncharacterized coiled-coil protein SlyX